MDNEILETPRVFEDSAHQVLNTTISALRAQLKAIEERHDIQWAARQMAEGKKVRRKGWDTCVRICLKDEACVTMVGHCGSEEEDYRPAFHCLTATDWEIYEENEDAE
jgi:hypothetical protein